MDQNPVEHQYFHSVVRLICGSEIKECHQPFLAAAVLVEELLLQEKWFTFQQMQVEARMMKRNRSCYYTMSWLCSDQCSYWRGLAFCSTCSTSRGCMRKQEINYVNILSNDQTRCILWMEIDLSLRCSRKTGKLWRLFVFHSNWQDERLSQDWVVQG